MNSLVTIYITNYNYAQFIRKSIDSVLGQSYQNIELIIIDDGSTDNSKEIIEEYRSLENVQIVFQQNKGLNITNNIALKLSRGDYIVRLDADDYFTDDAIETMVNELDSNPEIGLVFPDYYFVDEHDEITSEFKRLDFSNEVALLDLPAHGACTMIRTEYLKAVGGYNESYNCQDGYELWVKFTTKYKVKNIAKTLFYYRQHGNNLTSNEDKILSTRFNIKDDYIISKKVKLPKVLGIVPIRNHKLKNINLAFHELGNETILGLKIRTALSSKYLSQVVVTSSSEKVKEYISSRYLNQVEFFDRPNSLGSQNLSIVSTIDHILDQPSIAKENFDSVVVLSTEFPFLRPESIDEAILTSAIFNADSCISVRPDDSIFYQHHGSGMVPILNREKYTRLEREALFKSVGGLYYSTIAGMKSENNLLNGKVGHVVIDKKAALEIQSDLDMKMAKFIYENELDNGQQT